MTDKPKIDLDRLTSVYLKIRAKQKELSDEVKAKEAVLNDQLNTVKSALLEYCKEHGVESVRTAAGLVIRGTKTRYWTSDWERMGRFVVENECPEFFEKRLNQGVVREFLEENPDVTPPGLNVDSEYTITVRKK